jgi:hypothetical protein
MRVPAIIQSGWWVAAAAVVISLATAWIMIVPGPSRSSGDAPASEFALQRATVPDDLVVRAMAKDAVRVLLEPATMSPSEVDRWNEEQRGKLLVSDDRVIGVVIGDEARAYPLRLMRWHEVVNDIVGGEPISVTYSPLCDSVAVFSRSLEDEVIELGVSGYLYNSNTLLYDRRLHAAASPLWSQLDGQVVAEPDPGLSPPLPLRVAALATWGEWRERYPETRVLAPLADLKKLYKRNPYHSYFGSDLLHFPVRPLPPEGPLRLKDRLVVVTIDDQDTAFAIRDLATAAATDEGQVDVEAMRLPLRINFRVVPGTASVEALADPERLQAVRHTFWFAWYSLGGMIPDMDGFPVSDHTPETTNPSPGGA